MYFPLAFIPKSENIQTFILISPSNEVLRTNSKQFVEQTLPLESIGLDSPLHITGLNRVKQQTSRPGLFWAVRATRRREYLRQRRTTGPHEQFQQSSKTMAATLSMMAAEHSIASALSFAVRARRCLPCFQAFVAHSPLQGVFMNESLKGLTRHR